jgi:hypothetical protein
MTYNAQATSTTKGFLAQNIHSDEDRATSSLS